MDFTIDYTKYIPPSNLLKISSTIESTIKIKEKIIESRMEKTIGKSCYKESFGNEIKRGSSSLGKSHHVNWEAIISVNIESNNIGSFGSMFSGNDINIK